MGHLKRQSALLLALLVTTSPAIQGREAAISGFIADPRSQQIRFFWKDNTGDPYKNIGNLKRSLEQSSQELLFAMNGGMYDPSGEPTGLFIENGQEQKPINLRPGNGNFFLKPNGIFAITETGQAYIQQTEDFKANRHIRFATQSGPLLLQHGIIHPAFKANSQNKQIRNGVGVLPDGRILFAITTDKINLFDFADYFRKAGCQEALYLDGVISRAYIPDQIIQLDGNLGVLIGIVRPQKQ